MKNEERTVAARFSNFCAKPMQVITILYLFAAPHSPTKAIIRRGAPLPPLIFIGRAMICAPFAGTLSRLATFSNAGMF
jgi:hypothetical protein